MPGIEITGRRATPVANPLERPRWSTAGQSNGRFELVAIEDEIDTVRILRDGSGLGQRLTRAALAYWHNHLVEKTHRTFNATRGHRGGSATFRSTED